MPRASIGSRGTGSLSVGSRVKGFTLLEIIVVIVVMSLVGVLLVQGLFHYLKVRERIAIKLSQAHIVSLRHDWFGDVASSLLAGTGGAAWYFRGSAHYMAGVSLKSLGYSAGVPGRFVLKIAQDGKSWQVLYVPESSMLEPTEGAVFDVPKGAESWPLMTLDEGARFVYVDAQGERHKVWPPEGKRDKYLPSAILLVMDVAESEVVLRWVSVQGPKQYPLNVIDLLGG